MIDPHSLAAKTFLGVIASLGLTLGQVLPSDVGPFAQLGAVGILGYLCWILVQELKESRKDANAQREAHQESLQHLTDRWDSWEKIRHADSGLLQTTLTKMSEGCAVARSAMEKKFHEHE